MSTCGAGVAGMGGGAGCSLVGVDGSPHPLKARAIREMTTAEVCMRMDRPFEGVGRGWW